MESGHVFTADESRAYDPNHDLGGRYAPGLIDEIGDRIVILDEQRVPTLELLRFRQTLTTSPGFEVALRRRVERLRHFRHPAFARAPAVEYLGKDRSLALLSNYTPGRRLSEVLAGAQDPVLAASLIHQLTPALDALNEYGEGVGHGALTASRIVIAPDGHLIIVEHVLGSAVERLHLTTGAIQRDLGIPMPGTDTGYPRADGPTDCFQLAMIALAMLLGRSLNADKHSSLAGVLNATLPAPDRESLELPATLRVWLARALQLDRGFLSSAEARAALRDLDLPDAADIARRWRALHDTAEGTVEPAEYAWPQAEVPSVPIDTPPIDVEAAAPHEPVVPPVAAPVLTETDVDTAPPPDRRRSRSFRAPTSYLRWAVVALALCAIAEAFAIARLLGRQDRTSPPPAVTQVNLVTNDPGAPVMVDGKLAGVTPLDLSIDSAVRSISVGNAITLTPKQEKVVGSTGQDTTRLDIGRERTADVPARVVPAAERAGGIRVSSPIELEVFTGDRRLGSTATGIVSASAGRHELDLVNSVLGFRSRQVVDVKAGQVVAVTVSPPNGRININAVPWAEVLIDGKSVGETPIGNMSIPLGEHEIVFRHPQLGEVRQTAVVRSDAVARVSANFVR